MDRGVDNQAAFKARRAKQSSWRRDANIRSVCGVLTGRMTSFSSLQGLRDRERPRFCGPGPVEEYQVDMGAVEALLKLRSRLKNYGGVTRRRRDERGIVKTAWLCHTTYNVLSYVGSGVSGLAT